MIDPYNIINYNRNQYELEEFLLFAILVAGKNAKTTANALEKLLKLSNKKTPFKKIKSMIQKNKLIDNLKASGIGQYNRISKAFAEIIKLENTLQTISVEKLEQIYGIGPKTARFFVMFSRKTNKYAVLDTHMLKYLASIGYNVPKTTPSGKKYKELEQAFINEAKKYNKSVAEFDLNIWKKYNRDQTIRI